LLLDEPDLDAATLRAFLDAEFARKAAEEEGWPDTTDCDRLDAAFAALAGEGILGLHDAGFTMADGHSEAAEALADAPSGRYFGYAFYHRQDVERAIAGGGLWIAFDHVDGDVPDKLRVGRLVGSALEKAGLRPVWEGDPEQRIALPGFDWKRRAEAD
jgi:hypothetical protein